MDRTARPFLALVTAAGEKVVYAGALDDTGRLIATAADPPADAPARISIRTVAEGKRLVVLYERRTGERFARLAEIGYTREGSRFGQPAEIVECVVTGGEGTIPVMHDGKTYYVCCTGCRDYFNENPAKVLAEYAARKAAEKEKK